MLMFDEVACGYATPEGDKIIVRGIDRSVLAGQRIGILGANGQGKSTVVKTVARMQRAMGGKITEGKGLSIGYFAQQEMDVLRPDEGPLSHMVRLAKEVSPGAREQELRDFLGQFRFVGDMVNQAVGSLSGGEKARLVLAMLVWQRPNLLLLDEPTNHLDLQTREALSMALNEFEGTVMLVSHDRALLREVCDEFWLVTDGKVGPFDGDLDDYQKWLLDQSKEAAKQAKEAARQAAKLPATSSAAVAATAVAEPVLAAVVEASAPAPVFKREDRKASGQARQRLAEQTKPLRREMEQIDATLNKLADERTAVEGELASGSAAAARIAELGKRLKAIHDELESAELRWLELSAQVDAIQAGA
jgi:ATP-binding cassette subfamily F protein 3